MNLKSLPFYKLVKSIAALSLLLVLAACQTTGLKPGNLKSSFAPAGWEMVKRGQQTIYACPPTQCKRLQAVQVEPLKIRGDAEEAVRRNILSKQLMNSLLNVLKVESKGIVHPYPVRKITTRAYSGFEYSAKIKTQLGDVYFVGRWIFQGNRGVGVTSAATSRKVATRNLRRYLSKTRISRGQ